MNARRPLGILIPASNEAGQIDACLQALLDSDPVPRREVAVVVIANGCKDDTARRARAYAGAARARGWTLLVEERAQGSKPAALNAGEAAIPSGDLIYLDADVTVSKPLIAQMAAALDVEAPCYAGGTACLVPPRSAVSRAYARFWLLLPFHRGVAPGFGLFGVNAAGRARWGAFPQIISDDTFVRLQFAPSERVQVPATYRWPLAEGLGRLIRVRRRQDRGVAELRARYPDLMANEDKPPLVLGPLVRSAPLGFAAYALVALAVRLTAWRHGTQFVRGR